jgi:phosphoribosylformimino-5-aminoimidazole carboxamide ribotide isomerase
MDLYPAIDLRDGNVVRLVRGDYAQETVYGDDPVSVARSYLDAGASWVHVVDLDAARQQGSNRDVVRTIAEQVPLPVQTGGGVRTIADADELLVDAHVQRVVVGTAAFREPAFVAQLCAAHPGRVAVDVAVGADGLIAVHGWQEGTEERLVDALHRFAGDGVAAFVVTAVARDGMLEGPDLDVLRTAVGATEVPVIASGGVGVLDDLRDLAALGVDGVIVGKALYDGRFTIDEALEVVASCG